MFVSGENQPLREIKDISSNLIESLTLSLNSLEKSIDHTADQIFQKKHPAPSEMKLKAETKKEEAGSRIRQLFHLAPEFRDLPPKEQDRIFEACLKSYQNSVEAFEFVLSSLLFENREAKEFAKEMCQRMGKIVEAYRLVVEEEKPSQAAGSLTKEVMAELKDKITFSRFFGASSHSTGSMGFTPSIIQKAIKEGESVGFEGSESLTL